jgi:hypothetical protein
MLNFMQDYNLNINILYISLFLLISKYELIFIIFNKLYLLNYTSFFIIINIIGLYLFIKNISFEINLKFNIKYK